MLYAEYVEMTSTVESQLRAQLKDLQQKLGDLHCTDVNALRRAYTSLSQHVKALDIESKVGALPDLRHQGSCRQWCIVHRADTCSSNHRPQHQQQSQSQQQKQRQQQRTGSSSTGNKNSSSSSISSSRSLPLHTNGLHIITLMAQIDTQLLTPEYVSQEVGLIASVVSTVWVVDRGLRMMHVQVSPLVTRAMVGAAAALVVWRLMRSSSRRLRQLLQNNAKTKAFLLEDWQAVQQRIQVMLALVDSHKLGG